MAGGQAGTAGTVDEPDAVCRDYRPSAKLTPQDEVRLLDQALEEARARPRPPALAHETSGAAPGLRALKRPAGTNGHQLTTDRRSLNGLSFAVPGEVAEPDAEPDDIQIDRKRLLAAIICILQDELTKTTKAGGGQGGTERKRSTRRSASISARSTLVRGRVEDGSSGRR